MKKQYIPLAISLMASQAVLAQNQTEYGQYSANSCKTKSQDLNSCECYIPPWYDMQCDWGLHLSVDFLYWYGRECNLPYAVKVQRSDFKVAVPIDVLTMDTKWKPGVRVGLGWNMDCDGWDLYFQWTGYWNKTTDSASVAAFPSTGVPPVGGEALQVVGVSFQDFSPMHEKADAKWDFKLNRFDLQIGRRYWLSKCFTLRPYAGLGGIWTETDYDVTYNPIRSETDSGLPSILFYNRKLEERNRNWGVGFVGGLQPTWQFSECFALYADAGMALFWGELKNRHNEQVNSLLFDEPSPTVEIDAPFSVTTKYFCLQSILDLALGLRWETYWCDKQYHLAIDLGWEHHILFDHNQRFLVSGELSINPTGIQFITTGNYSSKHHDVDLGGFVLKVHFDF